MALPLLALTRCASFYVQKVVMQQAILFSVNYFPLTKCTPRNMMNSSFMCHAAESIPQIQLCDFEEHLKKKTCVIDVREPKELHETGQIPNSVNIPLGEVESAFKLTADQFKQLYNCPKPSKDDTLVLSCRSGKRSLAACVVLGKMGYSKVINFREGWLGWEEKLNQTRQKEEKL